MNGLPEAPGAPPVTEAATCSLSGLLTAASGAAPDAVASWHNGRTTTWQQLEQRVTRLAGALRRLDVESGDRVAVLAANGDDLFALLVAVPWTGAVLVPLNTRHTTTELEETIADCGCRLILADRAHAPRLAALAHGPGGPRQIVIIDDDDAAPSLTRLARDAAPLSDQGRGDDDPAVLCYTGGTTGRAKGVVLTHRSIVTGCLQWQSVARLEPGERMLMVAPMFHLAGLSNSYGAMLVRATVVLLDRFEPAATLGTMASQRVNYAVLVPAMISALLDAPGIDDHDLTSLRRITYGGSPISEGLLRRALARLPHTAFIQIYGQTESGVSAALMPEHHDPALGKLQSAGRPIAGVAVRIVDDQDRPLATGTWGEICLRSPGVARGYWNRPDDMARTFRGGWLHTGDIGYLDEDGFLHVVDRAKDMIISGGENVYSAEVERVLDAHPAVAESAVIGLPSERWGEEVHAVVRLAPGARATPAELIEHCRESLAGYKCPRGVRFRHDPLPRTPIGKVLKRELREAERDA